MGFELQDCNHWICCPILRQNAGLTFPLAQNLKFSFFGLEGVNKGQLGGQNMGLEVRDCHHRIHHQILPKNGGLTFLLAQN